MSSPLGLNADERRRARRHAVEAMYLCLQHKASVHYTQDARRWEGINKGLRAIEGEYPHYADCSSLTTWALWTATRRWGLQDFVNGYGWKGGYTGTQVNHGTRVTNGYYLYGDLAFYGDQGGGVPKHVAMLIGRRDGGRVISHGSEGGPYLLHLNYRSDLVQVRRYIR